MSNPAQRFGKILEAANRGASDEELRALSDAFWADTLGVAVEANLPKEKAKLEEDEEVTT